MWRFQKRPVVFLLCALLAFSLFACAPAAPAGAEATALLTDAPTAEPTAEPTAAPDAGPDFEIDYNQVVFDDELLKVTVRKLRYVEDDLLTLTLQVDSAPGNTYQYTNYFLRINGWTLPLMEDQNSSNIFQFLPDGAESAAASDTLTLTFPLSDSSFGVRLSKPREIQLRFEEMSMIDSNTYMTLRTIVSSPAVSEAVSTEAAPAYREDTTPLISNETTSVSLVGMQFGTLFLGSSEGSRTLRILFDIAAPAESEGSDVSFAYELYDSFSSEGDYTGFRIPAGEYTAIVESIPAIFTTYAAVVFPGTHATWGVDVNAVLDKSGNPLPEGDWKSALQTLTLPLERTAMQTGENGVMLFTPLTVDIDMTGLSPTAAAAAPTPAP